MLSAQDERYEMLIGHRAGFYRLIRRELGFSIAEWDALPWHHSRAYREALADEGLITLTASSHVVDRGSPFEK